MSGDEKSANLEIQALEKAWWDAWWAQDFSWDGLAGKRGAYRSSTLQEYWEAEKDQLIREPGTDRLWTRFHCPPIFRDGTPSFKANWTHKADWEALEDDLIGNITRSANACLLQGTVLFDAGFIERIDAKLSIQAAWAYFQSDIYRIQDNIFSLDFESAWLNGPVLLSRAHMDSARFPNATFRRDADFSDAVFKRGARFSGARFLGKADFSGAHFEGVATDEENTFFDKARFAGPIEFPQADFEAEANFNGAEFAGRANFYGVAFEDRALFDDIKCLENIHFYKAAFVRRLTINGAIFYGKANFEGVTDGDPIALSPQPIDLKIGEDGLKGQLSPGSGPTTRSYLAMPKLLAKDAVFYHDANFSNRDLLSPSTFESAQFHHLARFHGSQIHSNVSFHNAAFKKALAHRPQNLPPFPEALLRLRFCASDARDFRAWKKTYLKGRVEALKSQFTPNSFFDGLEASYRTLKQMMEDRRDRIREGYFFTLELLARRKRSDVPWWERAVSWLYSGFANYGNSIFRPLIAMGVSLVLCAAIYYQAGETQAAITALPDDHVRHLLAAFSFAWHNAFAPFSVLDAGKLSDSDTWLQALLSPANPGFALAMKIAATLQSMLTLLLAFLFALAARRRFQIN